jgi:hypothetical protein
MFENRMLWRKCGHNKEEIMGEWRKLHSEMFNNFYCSPPIIKAIKSVWMRWVGHVACLGELRN